MSPVYEPLVDWERRDHSDGMVSALTLKFTPDDFFPHALKLGDAPFYRKWYVPFPHDFRWIICGGWRFMGVDAGDLVEMDLELDDSEGLAIYRESRHKETINDYDAWEEISPSHAIEASLGLEGVHVAFRAAMTQANAFDKRKRTARVHWGLILYVRREKL